jgi:translation elongation factor EF-Tu-like GTPase
MYVVGTSGHVDHGKSSLVKALTGIDPDRLAEEKQGGMTIDLGFAWLRLPSGKEISLIDVPGHQQFIENMLAGVGAIDAVILVVAADDGVMPRSVKFTSPSGTPASAFPAISWACSSSRFCRWMAACHASMREAAWDWG